MTTQRFQVIFEAHTNRFRASMRALRRDIDGFASRVGRLGVRGGLLGTAIGGGANEIMLQVIAKQMGLSGGKGRKAQAAQ